MSHSSVIQQLLSANENAAVVQKGESSVFALQTRSQIVPDSQSKQQPQEVGVRISSVQTTGGKHLDLDEPPYIDFVKSAFTFLARKKEPILSRDLLIVVWRSTSSVATGFLFVPLKDESQVAQESDFDVTDSTTNDGIRFEFLHAPISDCAWHTMTIHPPPLLGSYTLIQISHTDQPLGQPQAPTLRWVTPANPQPDQSSNLSCMLSLRTLLF